MKAAGLILAAGAGTRFGDATKQLADLRGKPLLQHAVDTMNAALERVVVVLGHDADAIRARVGFGDASVVLCEDWAKGQGYRCAPASPRSRTPTRSRSPSATSRSSHPRRSPARSCSWRATTPSARSMTARPATRSSRPRVMDGVRELEGDAGARELLARFNVHRWEAGQLASAVDVDTPDELARLDDRPSGAAIAAGEAAPEAALTAAPEPDPEATAG